MQFGGVSIPDSVFNAALSSNLVIFAGAGVSAPPPVNLPLFNSLVDRIKSTVDPGDFLRERRHKLDKETSVYTETPEQYLSYLEHEGKNVKEACSLLVDPNGQFTNLHTNILRLLDANCHVRLVTTNFDNCFESSMEVLGCETKVFTSPALPLGKDVNGVVHLHGVYSDLETMILTAEDYGEAYVSNGWTARFLVDMFKTYTVLFVGYSCGDSLVDYLTRSISSEISGHAFVLCKDSDVDDWQMRGVEPIVFDDFDDLPTIFGDWASYVESSVTEKVIHIHDICQANNMSQADEDFIIQALRWPDEDDRFLFTSEFCKAASGIEHFQLLKNNGFLSFLSSKNPGRQDLLLLDWIVAKFSTNETAALQELCVEYLYELTPVFFERLFWRLSTSDIPENVLASWLPWLESADFLSQKRCEHQLVEIASRVQSDSIALVAIRILLKVGITFSRSVITGTSIEPSTVVSKGYYGDKLIETVKARSSSIGKLVFEYCFDQIERAYSIQTKCWADKDSFDGMSFGRSSIAPHDQDRFCDGVEGVLVDVARESINQNNYIDATEKCLNSKCSLLFRLGLWIKSEHNPSGSDLSFVAKGDLLSDVYIRHEVFRLIKEAFPVASDDDKRDFAEYVASRVVVGDRNSEYSCYNVCVWLWEEMNTCSELKALYEEVIQRNPNFAPREHPDFTHYMSSGFVDNSDECHLSKEKFNNDYLLELMQSSASPGSFITKHDRVSTPTRDYPLVAIYNLRELLNRECSENEIELMNLYIQYIGWNNLDISADALVTLLEQIVADGRTCVAGIESIRSSMIDNGKPLHLSGEALVSICEKALPNIDELFSSESAIIKNDNPDWVLMGINHPAGKYVELLAEADRNFFEEHKSHSQRTSVCFEHISEKLSAESDAARCVIACIFSRINVLNELNPDCFKSKLLYALLPDNWAFSSAWEGLSYAGRLTSEVWSATKELWPGLFRNYHLVGKNQFEQLVRLYVWIIIFLVKLEKRSHFLVVGASASKDALKSACMQLDNWMGTLDEEARLNEWDMWLAESFGKLALIIEGASDVLAEFYSRWIRKYPELRGKLTTAISKDCAEAHDADLFVFDGTLLSIAEDTKLTHNEKVQLVTFLLEHQKYLHFEADVTKAIQLIEKECAGGDDIQKLRDVATRRGLVETLSANS